MTTVKELSEGTVADAKKELPDLTDAQLRELHDLEEGKDDPRSTLLDAIHVEIDSRKKAGAEEGRLSASQEYTKGREAYRNGIPRDSSPFIGSKREDWLAGWDFQRES